MKKTALITGGATGIGRATAKLFLSNGYNVVAVYNKSESDAISLKDELKNIGDNFMIIKADLTNYSEVESLFNQIYSRYKKVDVVVNNAGVALFSQVQDTTLADYDKLFDVNMKSIFIVNNFALKSMLSNKYGKIVNVSSMWGERGASCEVVYSASKSAVIGYTKALAKEVGLSNINVNCVLPGVIDTRMNNRLTDEDKKDLADSTALNRLGTPLDVANAIFFLASDEASFITGQSLGVDGGFIG
jgi:3-oxoacyl-[acyl-carrier protein] reductase